MRNILNPLKNYVIEEVSSLWGGNLISRSVKWKKSFSLFLTALIVLKLIVLHIGVTVFYDKCMRVNEDACMISLSSL